MFQCQTRGTAKFNNPQESFGISTENLEHESDKTLRSNRVREIDSVSNINAHRKYRYRSKERLEDTDKPRNERILPSNHKDSPVDDTSPVIGKRPVRVGRRRLTTPVPTVDIPMVVPKKVNQEDSSLQLKSNFRYTEAVVDDQQLVTSNINQDPVDIETTTKPEIFEKVKNVTQNIPVVNYTRAPSHNVTRVTTNVTNSTSTRVSFRKINRYQANASRKVEAISPETTTQRVIRRPIIRSTEKTKSDVFDSTTPLPPPLSRGTVRSSIKNLAKEKPDVEDLEDENYPEHFKLLLKANYKSNLSTAAPVANKETKFQNFKSRKVVPYRGYQQSSSTSTTTKTPVIVPNSRLNFPRINRNDKRSKNVSIESNDVYVKDLDSTKENFDLVKETNYPEGTTNSGQFNSQIQQKEKVYKVTTFKPAISKLLIRNQSFKHRGPAVDTDFNVPPNPASPAPVSIKEVS